MTAGVPFSRSTTAFEQSRVTHNQARTTMSRVNRVITTKAHQQGVAVKQVKPGRPVNGPNLVAQHDASAKKAARKASSGRKSST